MKNNIVIIYLSLSLLMVQYLWMKAEKRNSYLEGKQEAFNNLAIPEKEDTCYAINHDCVHNPNGEITP